MAATGSVPEFTGGELVFAGGTDWAQLGRSGGKKDAKAQKDEADREQMYPNLVEPHILKSLQGIKIAFIAGGPAAVHCIACGMDGRVYTWGRNEKGQLGHGDLVQRNIPTVVEAFAGKYVTAASGGRNHSAFVFRDGDSFACGLNTHGQLGTGSVKKGKDVKEDVQPTPLKALVAGVQNVGCGVDFTVWLGGGKLFTAGNGQYGVLGDGADHSYNAKDSSIQIMYEPMPTPKLVATLAAVNVTKMAVGQQHCIAVDDQGSCWTWGNGGYGRLGHKIQQDEDKPRKVEFFTNRQLVPKDAVVAAGSTSTFCTGAGGQMYAWGKLKTSGDSSTSPQPVMDLSGWAVRSLACGPATFAVAADSSVITWGAATNGELGLGAHGKKSSANPVKCDMLDGGLTHQVACGLGYTMFLVDPAHPKLANLKVFESTATESPPDAEEDGGKGKAKAKPKVAAGAKRKADAEPAAETKKAAPKGKKAAK